MGFDVATFELILDSGFHQMWEERAIHCVDTNSNGTPRPAGQSLDAAGGLGLVLHFLCSIMNEVTLQEIFALVPVTVSQYINFTLDILLKVFQGMPDATVTWPTGDKFA
jgi:hypothetical protein